MSESLAVRHRPRRFSDVAGQRHVVAVLRAAVRRDEPPQQLLLAGPSGTGKTTLARLFAAALFCPQRTEDHDACGVCESCRDITGVGGRHPDVIELDAASHGGINEIREIASSAHIAPLRADRKLYIIDEAHGLTRDGGQAFLRLLEEPPAHTLFALATTDPDKLPTALRGRCLPCEVLPPHREELVDNLRRCAASEGWVVDDDTLNAVLLATDPALGVRGTVMTLEKLGGVLAQGRVATGAELEELLGTADPAVFAELTARIEAGDRAGALVTLAHLRERVSLPLLRSQLTTWARARVLEAVQARQPEALAVWRYEQIVEAGQHTGALEIAVARMAAPRLAGDVPAVTALLEQAEAVVVRLEAALAQATTTSATTTEPSAAPTREQEPVAAQPRARRTTTKQGATNSPAKSSAAVSTGPAGPHPRPAPAAVAETTLDERLPAGDPRVTALLNHVGRTVARAAPVLARCQGFADGDGVVFRVPADLVERAASVGLADLLEQAGAATGVPARVAA